jgi:ammonia channel protein AmtB
LKTHKVSLIAISRGSVAGIVAISALANDVRIWESALTGFLAGLVYIILIMVIKRSHVDDPAYTIASHLVIYLKFIKIGTRFIGYIISRIIEFKSWMDYRTWTKIIRNLNCWCFNITRMGIIDCCLCCTIKRKWSFQN